MNIPSNEMRWFCELSAKLIGSKVVMDASLGELIMGSWDMGFFGLC